MAHINVFVEKAPSLKDSQTSYSVKNKTTSSIQIKKGSFHLSFCEKLIGQTWVKFGLALPPAAPLPPNWDPYKNIKPNQTLKFNRNIVSYIDLNSNAHYPIDEGEYRLVVEYRFPGKKIREERSEPFTIK